MDSSLEKIVRDALNVCEADDRVNKVLTILKLKRIRVENDLEYLSFKDFKEVMNEEEFEFLSNPIQRMGIEQALESILCRPSSSTSLQELIRAFKANGVTSASDLKYFDWENLKELQKLSSMEIEKIMRFIKINFPEKYKEFKAKKDKENTLKRETELIDIKARSEKEIQEMRIDFSRKTNPSHPDNEAPKKKRTTEFSNAHVPKSDSIGTLLGVIFLTLMSVLCASLAFLTQNVLLLVKWIAVFVYKISQNILKK